MAGSVYTYAGNSSPGIGDAEIQTSQGLVAIGASGLFLPSEVSGAAAAGAVLTPGPSSSPASQLTAPIVSAGAAGNPNGSYRYAVTFVTAAGETTPVEIATPVVLTNQQGSVSSIPVGSTTSGVTARKLYRTVAGGGSGTEKLVATINDNTTTTYTDNVADGSLGATVPMTDTSFVVVSIGNFAFAEPPAFVASPSSTTSPSGSLTFSSISTSAADFQMAGTASPGTSGRVADARHIHPSELGKNPTGALAGDSTRPSTIAVPVLRDFVSIKDAPFNCQLDGVTDDSAGHRAAVAYIASGNGGVLWVGPGTTYLNSTDGNGDCVPYAVNSPGLIYQGSGRTTTRILLGASCQRFLEPKAGYANYSTWQNWAICDMKIDAVNLTGNMNIGIVGLVKSGGSTQTKLSVLNVGLFRVVFVNLPVAATNVYCRAVALNIQDASNQATQITTLDVFLDFVEVSGGCIGFAVTAGISGGTALNAFIDRVYLTRSWHDAGAYAAGQSLTPTGNVIPAANVQFGSNAVCGRNMLIEHFYGKNSADVASEMDNCLYVLLLHVILEDCWTNHFYMTNFYTGATLFDPNQQRVKFRDCLAIAKLVVNAIGAYATIMKNSVTIGTMDIRGCRYEKTCSTNSGAGVVGGIRSNSSGYGYALQVGQSAVPSSMVALDIDGLTVVDENSVWTGTGQWSAFFNLNFAQSGTPTLLRFVVTVNLNSTNSGTNYTEWLLVTSGNHFFRGGSELTINYNQTTPDVGFALNVGYIGGQTTGGNPSPVTGSVAGRLKISVNSITGETSPHGLMIAGSATQTIPVRLAIDFDPNNWPGSNSRITLAGTAQTNVTDDALGFMNFAIGGRFTMGAGAPVKPAGVNPTLGDGHWRTDTPTVANQRLYVCTAGGATPTWVGLI